MRYKEIVKETASAGASAAGNVATAVMGLGGGDPAASIYHNLPGANTKKKKKKSLPVLRRSSPLEGQKD